jgi:hypothetical protein
MSTDIKPYTPLKTIVSYVLDEADKSIGDFDKCWVLGLRGLTHLNYDVTGQIKTIRLPVQSNKTVPFPADCLSWSKIGNLNENGETVTLKINNSLTKFRDNNPNRLDDITGDINNGVGSVALVPYYANFYYNGDCYNLYGVGNGLITYGECRVDETNRVVILDPNFRFDSIMFEYLSSPQKDDDYQVPTNLQEAIIAFIKWKLKLASDKEYYGEVIKARRSLPNKKVILQNINQVIRESEAFKLRS